MQTIQMHLSQKLDLSSQNSCPFFKSALNFEHFQKTMTILADAFPKLLSPKDIVRKMSKNSRFRLPIDRQHGQVAETLIQFSRQHQTIQMLLAKKQDIFSEFP